MSAEATYMVDDVIRHRLGSEWRLIEQVGGPEEEWRVECVATNWRSPRFGGKIGETRAFGREYMDAAFARIRNCPDGGACHHHCARTECFRVRSCAPLSGYGEDWKPEDIERFGGDGVEVVAGRDERLHGGAGSPAVRAFASISAIREGGRRGEGRS